MELNRVEWTNDLADDIVARISIETQHHKMQRHGLEFIHRQTVEREVLFVDGIASVADDAGMGVKADLIKLRVNAKVEAASNLGVIRMAAKGTWNVLTDIYRLLSRGASRAHKILSSGSGCVKLYRPNSFH